MGIANYHISSRIYFRKWSNTAFAVFCSIGKEVIIGEISAILNELNTVKSALVNFINPKGGENLSHDETEQEEISINQILSDTELSIAVLLGNNSEITSIHFLGSNNNSISICQKALSGPFLILALLSNLKLQLNLKR